MLKQALGFGRFLEKGIRTLGSSAWSTAKWAHGAGLNRKNLAKGFDSVLNSRATGIATKIANKSAGLTGKFISNPVLGAAGIGMAAGALSWDREQKTFGAHMAGETLANAGDLAAFGLASVALGPVVGTLGYLGASLLGVDPGTMMRGSLERMDEAARRERRGGITPIKKNERTMAALNQSMSLLGQRPRGFLGNEASFMHN